MEFDSTHGKPGKPIEFDNHTWNFIIEIVFVSKSCEKCSIIHEKRFCIKYDMIYFFISMII